MNSELYTVVIATETWQDALGIVAKKAIGCDKIELTYTDRYAATVTHLLKILRQGFGWMEVEGESGIREVDNTRCTNMRRDGYCGMPCATPADRRKCAEIIRKTCGDYKRKYRDKISVHYVIIEKAGGIRGM